MNCSSLQLKIFAAILFVTGSAARAQMPDLPTPSAQAVRETMPLPSGLWSRPGNKIIVVTVNEPTVRHTCKIQDLEPDRLLCSQRHAEATIYRGQDIAVLIEPANTDNPWLWFTGIFSLGGGIIAGACFLASVAIVLAIPVALVGGAIVLMSPLAFDDENDGPRHDAVVYQKVGTTLAVKLR